MEEYVGNICPFCKEEIKDSEIVKVCTECGIPHHEKCWKENKGCTTFGCKLQLSEEQRFDDQQFTTDKLVCLNCGTHLSEGQAFCHKCGTSKEGVKKRFCVMCGTELQDGQNFCIKCGQSVNMQMSTDVTPVFSPINEKNNKSNSIKIPLIIGTIVGVSVIAIILVIVFCMEKKDFKDMYGDMAKFSWCIIASDGSYMKLDTNPSDKENDDMVLDDYDNVMMPAFDAIERINKELGFSDALLEEMNTTTWSQGRQTDSNDRYTVTWSYHPDKGLEVIYEFKK